MDISRPFKWTAGNQREMTEMNGENGKKIDGTDSDATIDTWYENEYVVEKVIGHRFVNGQLQYYLKWKDYSDEDNTWEDESDIFATSLVEEYWANQGGRPMNNTSSTSASVPNRRRRRYPHNAKDNDGDAFMLGSTNYDDNNDNQAKLNRRESASEPQDDGYLANYKPVPAMPKLNKRPGQLSVSNPEIEEDMWEDNVHHVETVERDKETKELLIYIKWVNGSRSCHKASVANKKCPQAVFLSFNFISIFGVSYFYSP
ncbi:chromatin organization modifier domain-containing protein [Gigaspora margarita]|uniref:Chromatin organization modifier domain-containing protein n=1 Tax=Gigaspora margarita TaxID=4874 RepID=A0A8H4ABQ1_GIGMA|nr:chromatin organization modifier domain-containing protein [Gigaspora margarita]